MKDLTEIPQCEYANELVSYVYGELEDREIQQFKVHLNLCRLCSDELESFGELRSALGNWKVETLAGFGSAAEPQIQPVRKVSAIAALREFFALSPLWMKGAVGFAAVVFCVLAVVAAGRFQTSPLPVNLTGKTYDENQVKELIARDRAERTVVTSGELPVAAQSKKEAAPQPKQLNSGRPIQSATTRRPLTRAEREQLAADLRLVGSNGDDSVNLISDRIND